MLSQQPTEPARGAVPAELGGPGDRGIPAFRSRCLVVFLKPVSVGTNVNPARGFETCQLSLPGRVCRTFLWPHKHQLAAQTFLYASSSTSPGSLEQPAALPVPEAWPGRSTFGEYILPQELKGTELSSSSLSSSLIELTLVKSISVSSSRDLKEMTEPFQTLGSPSCQRYV